jgi:hypothetical protein
LYPELFILIYNLYLDSLEAGRLVKKLYYNMYRREEFTVGQKISTLSICL